jgi:hypothetical protein
VGFEADGGLICEAVGGGGGEISTFYRDADSDGYGDPDNTSQATSAPAGYVEDNTDCDDGSNSVHPGAPEAANEVDDNCNGEVDEGVQPPTTFFRDADNDGYGDPAISQTTFAPGYVDNNTDCDDGRSATNPGAQEVVGNNIDDNCNGQTDESVLYLESFTLEPQQIYAQTGGIIDDLVETESTGRIVLVTPAAADTVVTVESSNPNVAEAPASVVVPAGQSAAEFTVIGRSPGFARITATLNGNSISAGITVHDVNDL